MAKHNRRINVWLLLAGAVVLVAFGLAGALMRPELEPDQVIDARFGDVSWNHEQHARMKEIGTCQVCHHQERPGTTQPRPCRQCHKPQSNQDSVVLADLHLPEGAASKPKYEGENGPPPMTAFHGKCIGCHRTMELGPVGCRDCHSQTFIGQHGKVTWDHATHARRIDMPLGDPGSEDAANDCQYCHHQDKDATKDADYRPCSACHKPAAEMKLEVKTGIAKHEKLLHGDCLRCHIQRNPEEDLRGCNDCHKEWKVDTEQVRPSIEQAMHERCAVCHNLEYPDLTANMPARCDDCHEPDRSVLADIEVGLILWDHDRHAKYGDDIRCTTCHHTDAEEQPHMACSRCHGTGQYQNPSVAEALKKRCIGCHQEKKNGLVSWDQLVTDRTAIDRYEYVAPDGQSFHWSHQKHAVAWSFSCRNCHHGLLLTDGESATGKKAEIEWSGEAAKIQTCRNCHGPEGPVAESPAMGTKAPALHDAFGKVCLDCHVQLGSGPRTWDEYFEIEPLKRPSGDMANEIATEQESAE